MKKKESAMGTKQALDRLVEALTESPQMTKTIKQQTAALLTNHVEQIEDCIVMLEHPSVVLHQRNPITAISALPANALVAAQGLPGAYSHIATEALFAQPKITFFEQFEEVTIALEEGRAAYGILPFENSSVGTVADITEYIHGHNCYINTMVQVKIEHCLCIHPATKEDEVAVVISHPQALMQCAETLKKMGLTPEPSANTAIAAEQVGRGESPLACLCSARSAALYGLKILQKNMQDTPENYTRFVCVARQAVVLPGADTISVVLSLPNQPGALGNLLTQFMIFHLDLTRIQSMPIAGPDFSVRFHLDFAGNLSDPAVVNLLGQMYSKYSDFQFLGNYKRIT